jgi:hypothetical protein
MHAGSFQLVRLFVDECVHSILNEFYFQQRWPMYRMAGSGLRIMHPLMFVCLETTGCLAITPSDPVSAGPADGGSSHGPAEPAIATIAAAAAAAAAASRPTVAPQWLSAQGLLSEPGMVPWPAGAAAAHRQTSESSSVGARANGTAASESSS